MTDRYLGLVVLPGEHITKIEVEEFASQMKGKGKVSDDGDSARAMEKLIPSDITWETEWMEYGICGGNRSPDRFIYVEESRSPQNHNGSV